jgi:NADPH:quinone reductase-like Zn-dependent oxidoreductase
LKAVQIHAHGGIDALRYEETAEPKLRAPSDVVVKLSAAAVNRIDLRIRRGFKGQQVSLPRILGSDGAGTIAAVGPAVTNVKPGDTVCLYPFITCGRCNHCATGREYLCEHRRVLGERENGTYAEYVTVPGKNCFPIPPGMSFEEAAAFPLVYTTAWRMLVTQAAINPGETILINGCGGIAAAAIQVAASFGAQIIVTSGSDEKLAKARKLGAVHGINHRTVDLVKEVRNLTGKRGVDIAIDCVGGDLWLNSLASLARGGRLITCGALAGAHPKTDLRRIFWNNLKVFGATYGTRDEFCRLLNFFQVIGVKPIIDRIYSLRDAAQAQQCMEGNKPFGKIILRMDG